MSGFFHLLNPCSMRAKAVRAFFDKNPAFEAVWVERGSHPTHLETVVEWAVNEGRDKIAVWGGDGTFSRVAQCLYNLNALEKVTVVLVPAGTCNDFARQIGIPIWHEYIKSVETFGKTERKIDVGLLTSRYGHRAFVNNSGFGREGSSIGARSNAIRDIFAMTDKRLDLEWTSNGTQNFETREAILGVVFNAPFFNGALYFEKNIKPDDNVMNAFFEPPQSRWALLWRFFKGRFGASLAGPNTFRVEGQNIRVESNGDLFPQVDGEAAFNGPVRSLEFSFAPGKLRLLI